MNLSEEMLSGDDALILAQRWEEDLLSVNCEEIYANGQLVRSQEYLETLEEKQCLEKIVWPEMNKKKQTSTAIIISAAAFLNKKVEHRLFGESVSEILEFGSFFDLAAAWALEQDTDYLALIVYIRFLINCFGSLEIQNVRKACLRYTSLPVFLALNSNSRKKLLEKAQLDTYWLQIESRINSDTKHRYEALLLPTLAKHMIELCQSEIEDEQKKIYISHVLEMFTDLVLQVPTRRFLHSVLLETRLYERLISSAYIQVQQQNKHFFSLPSLLFAFGVAMDKLDNGGDIKQRRQLYYDFQCACFKHFAHTEFGREIAFGTFREADDLKNILRKAPSGAPSKLAVQVLGLYADAKKNDDFAITAIIHDIAKRKTDNILENTVYPDEHIFQLKDTDLLRDQPLALPKLNLQFLNIRDYLERNFVLYRLEAFYEICHEVHDVVTRLNSSADAWARMACRIVTGSHSVIQVAKPRLGQNLPVRVEYELTVELSDHIVYEWDTELRYNEVVLLAQIDKHTGVNKLRGAQLLGVVDETGQPVGSFAINTQHSESPVGNRRTLRLALCPSQYNQSPQIYSSLNVVIRRSPKQNNFAAVLETIRDLIYNDEEQNNSVPNWLLDVLLGYGDPASAHYRALKPLDAMDFGDTFIDPAHLEETLDATSFIHSNKSIVSTGAYARIIKGLAGLAHDKTSPLHIEWYAQEKARNRKSQPSQILELEAQRLFGTPQRNQIRFTKTQIRAVIDGVNQGLSLICGPPGTGKTDVAVQIIATILRNNQDSKIVVVAHSNAALNDLFEKLERRSGIEPRELVRLGSGARDLALDETYSALGRLDAALERRIQLLNEVQRIAYALGADDAAAGYSCETAHYLDIAVMRPRLEAYFAKSKINSAEFPLRTYFSDDLFLTTKEENTREIAIAAYDHVRLIFSELESYRPLEMLRNRKQRLDFVLTNRARVIAMTCTHAAIARKELLELGFNYDTLIVEEAAQMLEIENFIPMLLQPTNITPLLLREDPQFSENDSDDDQPESKRRKSSNPYYSSCLRRIILLGDDRQLPPVVKNRNLTQRCKLEQSLFVRLLRLGVPCVRLDAQGRSRPSIANLWRWNYTHDISDLPQTRNNVANPGFVFEYQFIHVHNGKESCPVPHFYQNLNEAEYLVATYQYMRLLGYPTSSIAILATYRGQTELLRDILSAKCRDESRFGMPRSVSTVDEFQGQQADFVLLSLVRTSRLGYMRDSRRSVVAFSRARLGLYVFGCESLFSNSEELKPAFSHFFNNDRPTKLHLAFDDLDYTATFSRPLLQEPNNSQFVLDGNEMYNLVRSIALMQTQGDISIPAPFIPASHDNDDHSASVEGI